MPDPDGRQALELAFVTAVLMSVVTQGEVALPY